MDVSNTGKMEELSENGDINAWNVTLNCSNITDCVTMVISVVIETQIFGLSYFRIFLTMMVLLILCFLIRMCVRVLEYEITPPTSPGVPTLLFRSPKDAISKQKQQQTTNKRRYYLSPKKGCTCKLEFSSPVHS